MQSSVEKLAMGLARTGIPTSVNQWMWCECAIFTDGNLNALNPKTIDFFQDNDEQWNRNAAFACLDKILFREKMLYACVVGDTTLEEIENTLSEVMTDAVLSEPPPEISFVKSADVRERIPIEKLRKMKTVSPLLYADFNAVNPKVVYREDRFWYEVPARLDGRRNLYHQECPERMEMCSACSMDKIAGEPYDKLEVSAAYCPNCASNFCRFFYFSKHEPTKADIALRWTASVLIKIKEVTPAWGEKQPEDNIRKWMEKTIEVLRTHQPGVGKFVSHYGTTRMTSRNAANIMLQGQGKQITVDRQQTV